jgi:signal transduction histidine kinase
MAHLACAEDSSDGVSEGGDLTPSLTLDVGRRAPIASPEDSPEAIARDVAAIGQIGAVSSLLSVICKNTGMGFAAVARVTDGTWTACAVQDDIRFGLQPGGQLDVKTTLCLESRSARAPVVIDHASMDATYRDHHTPRIYKIESYISVPIVLPDGEYFGNLCAIDPNPHVVSDARTLSMFTAFADVIALQLENERKSEAARQSVESALHNERTQGDLREQFIAVLGHDLRNPLAAISNMAELLARQQHESTSGMGKRILASAKRMARLIDDVLDFARGRMGSGLLIGLAPEDDLTSALRQVVAELQVAHPERAVVMNLSAYGRIFCDRPRVQQLLSNLLGNALAHGDPDTPVKVEAYLQADSLLIAVSNGGRPISPENLDKVFEPYWRPSTSTPGGGLGLGLYICSQIVKAHGGTLEVASSEEAGTCFTAHLPIRAEG